MDRDADDYAVGATEALDGVDCLRVSDARVSAGFGRKGADIEGDYVVSLGCEPGVQAAQRAGRAGGGGGASGDGEAAKCVGQFDGGSAARGTAPATLLRALGRAPVQLDTVHSCHLAAAAVHHITEHPHLWACAWALAAHPTFAARLDLGGIARRSSARCRAKEKARAAVQIVDWMTYH